MATQAQARPLRIGLTGGIASGKSTVAALFALQGVPVIDTDELARAVVQPGSTALEQLVQLFGTDILDACGALDRKAVRQRVFADADLRRQLEAVLHPAIRAELERRSAAAGGPYQVLVIPLLVETGANYIDRVLVVDASPELQLQRLLARDRENEAQARAILAAQTSRAARLARADEVITNEGDTAALTQKVQDLHKRYLALAAQWPPADGDRANTVANSG